MYKYTHIITYFRIIYIYIYCASKYCSTFAILQIGGSDRRFGQLFLSEATMWLSSSRSERRCKEFPSSQPDKDSGGWTDGQSLLPVAEASSKQALEAVARLLLANPSLGFGSLGAGLPGHAQRTKTTVRHRTRNSQLFTRCRSFRRLEQTVPARPFSSLAACYAWSCWPPENTGHHRFRTGQGSDGDKQVYREAASKGCQHNAWHCLLLPQGHRYLSGQCLRAEPLHHSKESEGVGQSDWHPFDSDVDQTENWTCLDCTICITITAAAYLGFFLSMSRCWAWALCPEYDCHRSSSIRRAWNDSRGAR